MKKNARPQRDEPFDRIQKVASDTECTGLMPALPQDEAQDLHYAQLYAIHRAKREKK